MKTRMVAIAALMSAIMCSQASADGLLSRMLGRGCGGGCDSGASTCCSTPDSCGRGLHFSVDLHLQLPRLRRGGCGGCDTGCAAPVVNNCGCDTGCGSGGLLSGFSGFNLLNRRGGCCDTGCDSGCAGGMTAPVVAAGCGCDSAPAAADCGCGPACGGRLGSLLGRVRGLGGRFGNGGCCDPCGGEVVDAGCGCNSAPVSNGCGCDNGCGSVRPSRQICLSVPNFGLVDRIRSLGNRGGCCGGVMAAPVVSGGCGCNGAAPAQMEAAPAATEPTVAPPAGARNTTPSVDPNAFIIRGAGYQGR